MTEGRKIKGTDDFCSEKTINPKFLNKLKALEKVRNEVDSLSSYSEISSSADKDSKLLNVQGQSRMSILSKLSDKVKDMSEKEFLLILERIERSSNLDRSLDTSSLYSNKAKQNNLEFENFAEALADEYSKEKAMMKNRLQGDSSKEVSTPDKLPIQRSKTSQRISEGKYQHHFATDYYVKKPATFVTFCYLKCTFILEFF